MTYQTPHDILSRLANGHGLPVGEGKISIPLRPGKGLQVLTTPYSHGLEEIVDVRSPRRFLAQDGDMISVEGYVVGANRAGDFSRIYFSDNPAQQNPDILETRVYIATTESESLAMFMEMFNVQEKDDQLFNRMRLWGTYRVPAVGHPVLVVHGAECGNKVMEHAYRGKKGLGFMAEDNGIEVNRGVEHLETVQALDELGLMPARILKLGYHSGDTYVLALADDPSSVDRNLDMVEMHVRGEHGMSVLHLATLAAGEKQYMEDGTWKKEVPQVHLYVDGDVRGIQYQDLLAVHDPPQTRLGF